MGIYRNGTKGGRQRLRLPDRERNRDEEEGAELAWGVKRTLRGVVRCVGGFSCVLVGVDRVLLVYVRVDGC